MKKLPLLPSLLTLAAAALWSAGCAAPDANPPQARASTGYVDFHANLPEELCWEVERFEERAQDFQRVYSELTPPPNGVLRLAFAPGAYRLRVSCLNRVALEPVVVPVAVQAGMVTPVKITFTAEGTGLVQSSQKQRGPTAKGGFRNRTKFNADESNLYRLSAEAGDGLPYQPRERMPYAR